MTSSNEHKHPPAHAKGDDVRVKLLDAARQHFSERGYAASSLQNIADAAGVTKPMLYYYFGSKEGLYRTLVTLAHDELESELRAAAASTTVPRERLLAVARAQLRSARARSSAGRFLALCVGRERHGAPGVDDGRQERVFTGIVREILGGSEVADLVAMMLRGGLLSAIHATAEADASALAERIVAVLWDGLNHVPKPAA